MHFGSSLTDTNHLVVSKCTMRILKFSWKMPRFSFCFCKPDYDQQLFTTTLLHESRSLMEHCWQLGCQDFVDFTNLYQAYKTHVKFLLNMLQQSKQKYDKVCTQKIKSAQPNCHYCSVRLLTPCSSVVVKRRRS